MAFFRFTSKDLQDPSSMAKAFNEHTINTEINSNKPVALKTTASVDPEPQKAITTYTLSEMMQGSALKKPKVATYDAYNQVLSRSLSELLGDPNAKPESILGNQIALVPDDVLRTSAYQGSQILTESMMGGATGGITGSGTSTGTGATTPTNVAPGTTFTAAQIRDVASQVGFSGESLVIAIAVAFAESGGRVGVESKPNTNGTIDRGLWQINSVHSQYDAQRLLTDPAYNAQAAWEISGQGTNWRPWSTFNNGAYLKFMADARGAVG